MHQRGTEAVFVAEVGRRRLGYQEIASVWSERSEGRPAAKHSEEDAEELVHGGGDHTLPVLPRAFRRSANAPIGEGQRRAQPA